MSECTDRKCAREREFLYAQKNELEEACTRLQEEKETLEYKLNDCEETLKTRERFSTERELGLAREIIRLREAANTCHDNLDAANARNRELADTEEELRLQVRTLSLRCHSARSFCWYLTIAYLLLWILVRATQ